MLTPSAIGPDHPLRADKPGLRGPVSINGWSALTRSSRCESARAESESGIHRYRVWIADRRIRDARLKAAGRDKKRIDRSTLSIM